MIAISTMGKYLKGLIEYNDDKVAAGEASLLFSNNLTNSVSDFQRQYFTIKNNLEQKTNTLGNTVLHISLNFHLDDAPKLTEQFLRQVSVEFMELYGISFDQPYLIYRHFDKTHPHVHIILPNYTDEGKQIKTNYSYKKFVSICKNIEQEHGLVVASEQRKNITNSIEQTSEKTAIQIIESELRAILRGRPGDFETLQKKALRVSHTYGNTECNISYMLSKKGNGITFYLADKKSGQQISKGIKGSKIPPNLGYNKIMAQIEENKILRPKLVYGLQQTINECLQNSTDVDAFKAALKAKNITVKTFANAETKRIFGIEFKEGRSGAEFKGSEVHRSLSWNIIEKTLSDNYDKRVAQLPKIVTFYTTTEKAIMLAPISSAITVSETHNETQKKVSINLLQLFEQSKNNATIHEQLGGLVGNPYLPGLNNCIATLEQYVKENQTQLKPIHQTQNNPKLMYLISELKEKISIKELAEYLGFRVTEGKRLQSQWITMKAENRSAIIIANNKGKFNYYQESTDSLKKGSIVDFVIHQKLATTESDAVKWLNTYLGIGNVPMAKVATAPAPTPPILPSPTEPVRFMPYPFSHQAAEGDYLAHHGITKAVGEKLFPTLAGSLTSEEMQQPAIKNIAPYYKNLSNDFNPTIFNLLDIRNPANIVGQEIKGVGTKGHIISGSNKTYGAWFIPPPKTNDTPNALVITESPAKTLAYMSINPNENQYPFATMGNTSTAVLSYLVELHNRGTSLILGGDNDAAGQYFNARILASLASEKLGVTIAPAYSAANNMFTLTVQMTNDDVLNKQAQTALQRLSRLPNIFCSLEQSPEQWTVSIPTDNGISLVHEFLKQFSKELKLQATIIKPKGKDFNDDLLEMQNRPKKAIRSKFSL